jgi:hypothetical protein
VLCSCTCLVINASKQSMAVPSYVAGSHCCCNCYCRLQLSHSNGFLTATQQAQQPQQAPQPSMPLAGTLFHSTFSCAQYPAALQQDLCSSQTPIPLKSAHGKCCSLQHPAQHQSSARQQLPSSQHARGLSAKVGGCLLSAALGQKQHFLLQDHQAHLHVLCCASP